MARALGRDELTAVFGGELQCDSSTTDVTLGI